MNFKKVCVSLKSLQTKMNISKIDFGGLSVLFGNDYCFFCENVFTNTKQKDSKSVNILYLNVNTVFILGKSL